MSTPLDGPGRGATDGIVVRRAAADDAGGLAGVLVECVEDGASVGFMLPLTSARAQAFWRRTLESAARRERVVLVAGDARTGVILGTAQLVLALPENQPHRGDVAKMLVRPGARRRGVGAALLLAAEAEARRAGRTLLVLDTANPTAARLYERHGWRRVGEVPDFALFPGGGYCPTTYYYRDLRDDGAGPAPDASGPSAGADGLDASGHR